MTFRGLYQVIKSNNSSKPTDYRLTDAKVEPFYNEAEKMRNDK